MKTDRSKRSGTIDRRVARTRALLQNALIVLITSRGYAAITVEDICTEADVGRSTFYSHYTGKAELRTATIDANLLALSERGDDDAGSDSSRRFKFSLPIFQHAGAFREMHQALLQSVGDTIHDEIRERIRQSVRMELKKDRTADPFAVEFVAGAFLAVLGWWIGTDTGFSAEQIDDRFQKLAMHGLGGALAEIR